MDSRKPSRTPSPGCSAACTSPSSTPSLSRISSPRYVVPTLQALRITHTDIHQIIKTFGFSELNTYLVQAPPYAIAYACACALAWSSGKFRESCYHIVVPIVISAAGTAIMISTPNIGARYFGAVLLVSGTYNGLNLQLSWETTLVPAPRSKKAALIAIANCVSQCSHWFSPYFFPTAHEPFYRLGGGLILFGCLCTVLLCFGVKWWAKRLNKKLDAAEGYSDHSGVERGWRFAY